MASKITQWLLHLLVLSLGFGNLLRFEVQGLPLYLHDLLLTLVLLLNLRLLPRAYRAHARPLRLFFVGLLLANSAALYYYPLAMLAVPYLYTARLLAYLSLYFLLRLTQPSLPLALFRVAALTAAAIGLVQYFFLPDMRWAQYLGWDDHLHRLTLPHFDPTFTGVMLALALLSTPLTPYRSAALLLTLTALLALPAILLTYSRSVWLTLVLTALTFIKNKLTLLPALALMLVVITALPQKFGEGNNLLRTYSITARFRADLTYLQTHGFSLLLGRGLNTLKLSQPLSPYPNHATGPNNSYLYLLTTTGILGLVGWGIFLLHLYRHSRFRPMLVFLFLASLFNNVMFYPFALLWVLLIESKSTAGLMVPTAT